MVLELCDEDGCFQGREVLSKKIDLSRTESQVKAYIYICHLVILGCIWIRLVSERMFWFVLLSVVEST